MFSYVSKAINSPRAGQANGGPGEEQAWCMGVLGNGGINKGDGGGGGLNMYDT